ncbi:FAD-dependent oxidoreductase [Vacuolonema iberomarrocanum]|uniref:FAD-dependent oxidoreductase n=1 Tax=Vacuolonema iberomarrocanum TaxID=3454632 RepID=UPI001A00A759|nr:NAD(P)/FAD-dependent oxidoreductase [filamentous cyanobacterium LEGE 07170]
MAVDYDLVILGGTAVGREIAQHAAKLQARVALVEPREKMTPVVNLLPHALRVGGYPNPLSQTVPTRGQLGTSVHKWARQVAQVLDEENGITPLLSLGVDWLTGTAEFCNRPTLGVRVGERILRSRTFLLLLPQHTRLPNIPGLDNTQPLTPEALADTAFWQHPPKTLAILGNDGQACELAQGLTRCGIAVTLISDTPLLPDRDAAIATPIQALLEAEGVRVLAPTPIERCRMAANQRIVQTEFGAIAAEQILVTGDRSPDTAHLNLAAAGITLQNGVIPTSRRLQTANHRIYSCPSESLTLARQTADIALKNALFFPVFRAPAPTNIPQLMATEPPLICFGLTETQAQQQLGDRFHILQPSLKSLPKAQLRAQTSGLCRLIVQHNGRIRGGQILGAEAEEWGSLFLLMFHQKIRLSALEHLPFPSPSMAEQGRAIAQDWRERERDRLPWIKNRLDLWFDARRSYFRA